MEPTTRAPLWRRRFRGFWLTVHLYIALMISLKRQQGEANHRWARSKVWIDQYSGQVLAEQDSNRFTSGETFLNLMWPLHNSEALGRAGRIL